MVIRTRKRDTKLITNRNSKKGGYSVNNGNSFAEYTDKVISGYSIVRDDLGLYQIRNEKSEQPNVFYYNIEYLGNNKFRLLKDHIGSLGNLPRGDIFREGTKLVLKEFLKV